MTCLGRVLEFAFGWLRVQLLPGVTPVNFAIYVFSVVVTISLFVFINANQPYTLSHIGVSDSEKGAVSARLTIIGEMVSVLHHSQTACLPHTSHRSLLSQSTLGALFMNGAVQGQYISSPFFSAVQPLRSILQPPPSSPSPSLAAFFPSALLALPL